MATNDSTPRTIEIQLTRGYVALIDEQDADLALLKWHSMMSRERSYAARSYKPVVFLHKQILERVIGRVLAKGEIVDHVNNNSLDCRRNNLRLATPIQNGQNRKINKNNTSGFKGVTFRTERNKWIAHITVNKKCINLGLHSTKEEAAEAYRKAATKYFGEFARFE